ncbi:hypothetical protein KJZ00_06445 [Cutibacterium avidum]|uniref:PLD nuclease N-terminal domain-containing protein n=1 Tax=Cutibacterium avidum TaxID=33010 RepID=UPI0007924BC0|nr:PLD nuclease N-terminal domain-containing protein [Cutibacterium avidum]KXA68025.1 hypothetical protein HMPREF3223_00351 [Cutibacterium avidum]MCO6631944.1 hypothetical protein [Cutibacterium avidum]MCO6660399.1 hypothetical protein [Cutibacterium avidum]MCO6664251.1 hypothetical protein [Cutibacterium avidum]MCO6678939.1 hypothetical protein [Cutibacterium avidum]
MLRGTLDRQVIRTTPSTTDRKDDMNNLLLATVVPLLAGNQLEWLWGLGILPVVALVILWLASVVSVLRSRYGWGAKLLFVFGTLAFPVLGPLIWFFAVRSKDPHDMR